MAGEWIKVEVCLSEKPEVLRLSRSLGIDSDAVVGKLLRLWAWFGRNSVDGVVDGVVDADVDRVCCAKGFAASLVSVGWLCIDSGLERVSIPRFERHNGESAKKRALKSERQSKWRSSVDARVSTQESTEASTQASTGASTREEKRRIDKKAHDSASAPSDVSPKVFSDWCALRKVKRAAVTDTAIRGVRREAEKAGIPLEEAMSVSCERGWAGFKADWFSASNRSDAVSVADKFSGAI